MMHIKVASRRALKSKLLKSSYSIRTFLMMNDPKICSIRPTGLSFFLNMSLHLVDFSSNALFCSSRCNGRCNGAKYCICQVATLTRGHFLLLFLIYQVRHGVFHPARLGSGIASPFRTTLAMRLLQIEPTDKWTNGQTDRRTNRPTD